MKIKKMGLYAWALVAAMVVSMLPMNAASVKAADTKTLFSYDAETATALPAELSSAFAAPGTQWEKTNAIKFADAAAVAKIPVETVSSGKVMLEVEFCPASKSAQNVVVKNSAGENLFILGNNIGGKVDGTQVDGKFYIAEALPTAYSDDNAAVKGIDIGTIKSNTWFKANVEIDLAAASYKVSVKGYDEQLKYGEDAAKWLAVGETTQKITASKVDVASVEICMAGNARWMGDIIVTAEAGAASAPAATPSAPAAALASKSLDANKLEVVDYISETKVGEFIFYATGDKPIFVSEKEAPAVATDGREFTKQAKFQGGADQIKFDAGKGAKVTVYYTSGGSDERTLGFYSTTAAEAELAAGAKSPTPLATSPAPAIDGPVAVATFDVAEAGQYYIASVTKGMVIYAIDVKEVEAEKPATTTPAVTTPAEGTYVVQKGDTLCAIARNLFNSEAKWKDLYELNKDTIKDPALIHIGQVLKVK